MEKTPRLPRRQQVVFTRVVQPGIPVWMRLNRRQKRDQLCQVVRITCLAGLRRKVVVLSTEQAKMLEVAVAAIWVRPASQDLVDKRRSGID